VVEATRLSFRPERITTLFVGESAPASGDFFYYGKSAMTRCLKEAIENALAKTDDFLEKFKRYGWYLDDLCSCRWTSFLDQSACQFVLPHR
jgi:hypothetical protein